MIKNLVILCGADRTGKTTLAEEFKKEGYEYIHFNPPKGSPYQEYLSFAEELPVCENLLVDRYMYCEFPYSDHYCRETDMTVKKMKEIESLLKIHAENAVVVYCATDLWSNWERIQEENKKEFETIQELARLRTIYTEILNQSTFRVLTYNFKEGDTFQDLLFKIYRRK